MDLQSELDIPATDWSQVKTQFEHYPAQKFRPNETPESCCDGGKLCPAPPPQVESVNLADRAAITDLIRRTTVTEPLKMPVNEQSDIIRTPPHYTFASIEPLDAIQAWGLPFCLGNVVKYVVRAGRKGDELTDLEKAAEYLRRHIEHRKKLLNAEEPIKVSER